MEIMEPHKNTVIFDHCWSINSVEQSYNTQSKHKVIKIALSKQGIEKVICFSVENIELLDLPMDPFGIVKIVIAFRQNSKQGQIYLECEEVLESTTINCSNIEIS
jgi:hypothetical protein